MSNIDRLKKKRVFFYLGSFLLPLFIVGCVYFILELAPFGNKNLLVSDLGTQYMHFLSMFKRMIQEGTLSFYSFSNVIGGTVLPLAAYYLLSPFNFIALAFPYEELPIAILLIIGLKIAFMGLTMAYYLEKTYRKSTYMTWLFSTSYSLCGFVVVYCLNFMWLDALILLPLLVLGIQRLWDEGKYLLYSLALFAAIVTNYYLGYMLCIFAVFYSFYWRFKEDNSGFKKNCVAFFKDGKLFWLSSILTGVATSFILIPAVEGMLQTKKTNFDSSTFLPYPKFGTAFFSQFGLGAINFELRLDHLPTIFSGILMTMLFISYFLEKRIPKREKKATAYLLGFIFLSFWLDVINTIWHMFQSPAGFPYRNAFIFSFLVIKFAYEAYLKMNKKEGFSLSVPFIFSALLLLGYISLMISETQGSIVSSVYLLISLFFIWLYYFIIRIECRKNSGHPWLKVVLVLLVCLELGGNYWIALKDIPFGNQQQFASTYRSQSEIIDELEQKNGGLFRLKQTLDSQFAGYSEQNNGYNNSFLYGYAGVSGYTSTLDANVQEMLNDVGLYEKNDRRISYVDDSQVINMLLNVPYEMMPTVKEKVPLSFSTNKTNVYENSEAIGMGFLAANDFDSVKLKKNEPIENQENILQGIKKIAEPYFKSPAIIDSDASPEDSYSLTVKPIVSGNVYFRIPDVKWKTVDKLVVNGEKINQTIYVATNQLFNLGYAEKDELLSIQVYTKKKTDINKWQLATLDQQVFDNFIEKERKQALQLYKRDTGTLRGNVSVSSTENQLLFLSVPYDRGWQVKVDGQKVKTFPVLTNFTGIHLSKGNHQIEMKYRPRSFQIGLVISLIVLSGVGIYYFIGTLFRSNKFD